MFGYIIDATHDSSRYHILNSLSRHFDMMLSVKYFYIVKLILRSVINLTV